MVACSRLVYPRIVNQLREEDAAQTLRKLKGGMHLIKHTVGSNLGFAKVSLAAGSLLRRLNHCRRYPPAPSPPLLWFKVPVWTGFSMVGKRRGPYESCANEDLSDHYCPLSGGKRRSTALPEDERSRGNGSKIDRRASRDTRYLNCNQLSVALLQRDGSRLSFRIIAACRQARPTTFLLSPDGTLLTWKGFGSRGEKGVNVVVGVKSVSDRECVSGAQPTVVASLLRLAPSMLVRCAGFDQPFLRPINLGESFGHFRPAPPIVPAFLPEHDDHDHITITIIINLLHDRTLPCIIIVTVCGEGPGSRLEVPPEIPPIVWSSAWRPTSRASTSECAE